MYAITYKRNNLTITVKAEDFHKVLYPVVKPYYEISYSGYTLAIYEDELISIKPYKPRTKQRSY